MKHLYLGALLVLMCVQALGQLTNESELGIAAANGNTRTQTYQFKQENDYKWSRNVLGFRSRFLNSEANGVETARFFMVGLRYENQVSDKLGFFVGETLEQDRFAGIDDRYLTDAGGKYRFIETDRTKLFTELGYRYMHENRLDETMAYSNFVRSYTEWEHKWNTNFSTKYWAELLPNITDQDDWLFNTEFSIAAMLNSVFSLKTSYLLRFDNEPAPGIVYDTDTLFSTALVAKF